MQDFKDEQDPLEGIGAEPLAGSGLEDESDGEFTSATADETEGQKQ